MKIARTGNVTIAGRLGDGAAFSSGAFLHADRAFPLYAVLYSGTTATRGSLRGMLQLPGETPPASTLEWFKPARLRDRLFPEGFAVNASPAFIK